MAGTATISWDFIRIQLSTPGLSATVASISEIDLSWNEVGNESSYKLEWSADGISSWTQIGGTITAGTTSYNHTGTTTAKYYYRISAIGDGVNYDTSKFGTINAQTRLYATWNAVDKASTITLSNGALSAISDGSGTDNVRSTIGKSTGKWYWEILLTTKGATSLSVGVETISESLTALCGTTAAGYGFTDVGQKKTGGIDSACGTVPVNGNTIGFELDMGAGTLTFYLQDVSQCTFSGLSGTFYAGFSSGFSANNITANFGATTFTYTGHSTFNQGLYN